LVQLRLVLPPLVHRPRLLPDRRRRRLPVPRPGRPRRLSCRSAALRHAQHPAEGGADDRRDGSDPRPLGRHRPGGAAQASPAEQYAESLYRDIAREGVLFAAAAAVVLFIACLGLFGTASFVAERRTKEIGIRKVLGTTTGQVTRLLLWQFTRPVLWANLLAWPVVWWLMRRWLAGFSAHVPLEPWLFLAALAFTLLVTLATVGGQAFLVARRPPVAALRYERGEGEGGQLLEGDGDSY
jgi:hypothetical protein